jgi:hypothetical protein
MKNPWVVAILNYFFWGLGTLLLGKRPAAGLLLLVGNVSLRYADVMLSPAGPNANAAPQLWPFIVGGMAVAGIGCAIDGFNAAKAAKVG